MSKLVNEIIRALKEDDWIFDGYHLYHRNSRFTIWAGNNFFFYDIPQVSIIGNLILRPYVNAKCQELLIEPLRAKLK